MSPTGGRQPQQKISGKSADARRHADFQTGWSGSLDADASRRASRDLPVPLIPTTTIRLPWSEYDAAHAAPTALISWIRDPWLVGLDGRLDVQANTALV
jgi:hypothetical protein